MPDVTIRGVVNPLAFLEVDEPWAEQRKTEVSLEHILAFLCNPGDPRSTSDLVARYRRISVEDPRLFMAPAEPQLLHRLIWPLRQAKGCFLLGHYLATVSLCGMVAEMAAILTFDMADVEINGRKLGADEQKALYGSTFEKLGQERRVSILAAYGVIDEGVKQCFDQVRAARRRYLHLWSASHVQLEKDAIDCFTSTVKIVVGALGIEVADGRLLLKAQVLEYLKRHNAGPAAEGNVDV